MLWETHFWNKCLHFGTRLNRQTATLTQVRWSSVQGGINQAVDKQKPQFEEWLFSVSGEVYSPPPPEALRGASSVVLFWGGLAQLSDHQSTSPSVSVLTHRWTISKPDLVMFMSFEYLLIIQSKQQCQWIPLKTLLRRFLIVLSSWGHHYVAQWFMNLNPCTARCRFTALKPEGNQLWKCQLEP